MSHLNFPNDSAAVAYKHFRTGESAHGLQQQIVTYLGGLLAPQTLIAARAAGAGSGGSYLVQIGTLAATDAAQGPPAGVVDCAFRVTADAGPQFDVLTAQMLAEIASRHPVGSTFNVYETIVAGSGAGASFLVGLFVEVVPPPPPPP